MIITSLGEVIGEYPIFTFQRRKEYFLRLVRVEVSPNAKGVMTAHPFYQPTLRVERHAGQIVITVWRKNTAFLVFFFARFPFFSIRSLDERDE